MVVTIILLLNLLAAVHKRGQREERFVAIQQMRRIVAELGLSDLAVSTEARYTRHPAVSDPVVPFMDHPGNIEHFPSGIFWRPVQ